MDDDGGRYSDSLPLYALSHAIDSLCAACRLPSKMLGLPLYLSIALCRYAIYFARARSRPNDDVRAKQNINKLEKPMRVCFYATE